MAVPKMVGLFDIGATHTRVALAEAANAFGRHDIFQTDSSAAGLDKLVAALRQMAGGHELAGLFGGVAAQISPRGGTLWHATNLPHWNGLALGRELEQRLGAPVTLANDTAVVGLGEATFGAGRGYGLVMYETVSTGVNAARIVDGAIDRASQGVEVGEQLIVGPDGRVTTLEAATGGASLERQYGRPPRELASQGLWRSEARLLALGLYNSLLHWSPEVVVFGGSMMRDIELSAIEAELNKLPLVRPHKIPLVPAQLGDNGGLYGALALARQHGAVG